MPLSLRNAFKVKEHTQKWGAIARMSKGKAGRGKSTGEWKLPGAMQLLPSASKPLR